VSKTKTLVVAVCIAVTFVIIALAVVKFTSKKAVEPAKVELKAAPVVEKKAEVKTSTATAKVEKKVKAVKKAEVKASTSTVKAK